jgi:hypothetical protein
MSRSGSLAAQSPPQTVLPAMPSALDQRTDASDRSTHLVDQNPPMPTDV